MTIVSTTKEDLGWDPNFKTEIQEASVFLAYNLWDQYHVDIKVFSIRYWEDLNWAEGIIRFWSL